MQYSSKPPFNDDPHPYVWCLHSPQNKARSDTDMFRKGVTAAMAEWMDYEHLPRAGFDRPQHNPTNPILAEFRSAAAGYRDHEFPLAVSHYLSYLDGDVYGWAEEHKDHARRVLSRLSAS